VRAHCGEGVGAEGGRARRGERVGGGLEVAAECRQRGGAAEERARGGAAVTRGNRRARRGGKALGGWMS
jgi:hypothetical protein